MDLLPKFTTFQDGNFGRRAEENCRLWNAELYEFDSPGTNKGIRERLWDPREHENVFATAADGENCNGAYDLQAK